MKRIKLMLLIYFVSIISIAENKIQIRDKPMLATQKEYNINFNKDNYEVKVINVNGKEIKYRAYEKIVYVKYPKDLRYHVLNFYVPEIYYENKKINGYTLNDVPIFFPNGVGGYMPSEPLTPSINRISSKLNSVAIALEKGYVVASSGVRGRSTKNINGENIGSAPAAIVDLKSAVKYLKYNDKIMPGDANKIISNGTSAGGALSTLLGATGNNKDYYNYFLELGAANAKDDIFAVSAYCPITNLENADMAYEWQFNNIYTYKKMEYSNMIDFRRERKFVEGNLTNDQIKYSKDLAAMFPKYLNSLKLKSMFDNSELNLNIDGTGSFSEYVKIFIKKSIDKAKKNNIDLSKQEWINNQFTISDYASNMRRMKVAPAFDGVELNTGENNLFGDKNYDVKHFTNYSLENTKNNGAIANKQIIKMMNPMNYIGSKNTTISKRLCKLKYGK